MKLSPRPIILTLALIPATLSAQTPGPKITAPSAIVIDAVTGKVLWERDAHSPRYPASTTKIMTGLLLLERVRPEDTIIAPADIEKVGQSSMHLKPGEQVSARDLLYAIMLRSANDGCYAIAKHVAGSVQAFSQLMNERARELGCKNTRFTNPNGLNDPMHQTTAFDLALIGREAMKDPEFRNVAKTMKIEIRRSKNQADRVMVNRNKLLRKDPTIEGIKTGYTKPAGHCFVGSATREDFRVITVVLKSADWQADTSELVRWAYDEFDTAERVKAGEQVGEAAIEGGHLESVPVVASEPLHLMRRQGDTRPFERRIEPIEGIRAPIRSGQTVGRLIMKDADGFESAVEVRAAEEVRTMGLVARAGKNPGFLFVGGLLCAGVAWMRSRANKMGRRYARATAKSRSW